MNDYRILVVDDEEDLCEILKFNLENEGYEVDTANSAEEALKMDISSYHLILLDVMKGEISVFKMANMLKKDKKTARVPIIFITAKDTENDTVTGFNLGADDYIIKPFRNLELLSRIKNVLRRNVNSTQINIGSLRIDTDTRKVYLENNEIPLTKLEFEILKIMAGNPRKVFTREEILSYIWDSAGNFVNDNTLTVTVKRLREKLGDKEGKLIVTVRGVGYKIGDMSK